MATLEEKQELVEALQGPHHYHIVINGYGGETVFSKINKEAKEFWHKVTEDHGDGDLITYCTHSEDYTAQEFRDGACEFENIDPALLTDDVLFLHDPEEPEYGGSPWFEPPNEYFHNNQANYSGSYLYVSKINYKGDMWPAPEVLEEVIDGEDIEELVSRIGEETDYEVEMCESISSLTDWEGNTMECETFEKGDHVFQFHSAEKGCFFEAVLETPGLFDIKKLRVVVDEDAAGNDVIWGLTYNGESIENDGGGDTNGKGYYAWVWTQEW